MSSIRLYFDLIVHNNRYTTNTNPTCQDRHYLWDSNVLSVCTQIVRPSWLNIDVYVCAENTQLKLQFRYASDPTKTVFVFRV